MNEAAATAGADAGFADEIRRRFPAGEADTVIEFGRELLARGDGGDVGELSADERLALVLSAFRFFARRTSPVRARVWNPTRESDGWDSAYTVFESHLTDRPFIVDTVREFFRRERLVVRRLLHPIYAVERDEAGKLVRLREPESNAPKESFLHVALDRVTKESLPRLEREIEDRLADLYLATEDYVRMRERTEAVRQELEAARAVLPDRADEIDEARAFLRWLRSGSFVYLGARSYGLEMEGKKAVLRPDLSSGLGIFRREQRPDAGRRDADDITAFVAGGPIVSLARTAVEATVHRSARMEAVAVDRLDASGRVVGQHRFLGFFTRKAYADESDGVPILRRKLRRILEAEAALPDSHDWKEIVEVFNSIPKTELFELSPEDVRADVRAIRGHRGVEKVRVRLRSISPRDVRVLVVLHRDRYSGELRAELGELLEVRLGGRMLGAELAFGSGESAHLHFEIATRAPPKIRAADLEREIADRMRSWDDRLRERVLEEVRGAKGRELAERYLAILTEEYKASTPPEEAWSDVRLLEELARTGRMQIAVTNPASGHSAGFSVVQVYLRGEGLVLSDFLPTLENLGLRVFTESPLVLGSGEARTFLHRFAVLSTRGQRVDVEDAGPRLAAAIRAVWDGLTDSDALGRLVLDAGLGWREVALLRTYRNAAFQMRSAPSRNALNDALLRYPDAARTLIDLFVARLGLEKADRERRTNEALERFLRSIETVETSADDRMLRNYLALVEATVRTSFFRPERAEHPYLAIKLRSHVLDFVAKPRPLYEIWVHSARMEGAHLRGGKVARGGIRFSDRHDDFRTEAYDLMKTQMVKNAVIVPVGSKGAFIVKRPKAGAEEAAAEVRECYATLVRGLLDLTDDVARGEIVPPSDVVRHDGDDPYLVVAADKGTATFSDLANSIAASRGFWLGDAFASGGSNGYDHKKEGITARGAWEAVRRHFRELGKDVQNETFNVVGIGDMSGDVFGNGMLQSRKILLRAAFDHRHIFLDPTPDAEASFAERRRLFDLPQSSWADYDRSVLSRGGTILPRSAKTEVLTAEVQGMLGTTAERLDGEGLVRAILAMETDLLWNGGIGTYVRASSETNAEVGDPANDAVRITASELRSAVVVEGGNLGLTQRARTEYALRGGRINTDAIDNSGGVDLSDHEVNLKILFQPLVEARELAPVQRNRLLQQAKPDVIASVLSHNARQVLLLSLDQLRSRTRMAEFREQMTELDKEGIVEGALEALPDRETARERRVTFLGLARPELAVLTAVAKLSLQRHLLASDWTEDPALERYLFDYFPPAIGERFPTGVRRHRLRREIIATELGNQVIDRMGSTFAHRIARDTGYGPAAAVAAWTVVVGVSDADRPFDALAESSLPPDEAYARMLRWESAVELATKLIVGSLRRPGAIAERIEAWRRPVAELADLFAVSPPVEAVAEVERLEGLGLQAGIARALVALEWLRPSLEIVQVAEAERVSLAAAEAAYRQVSGLLDFAAVDRALDAVSAEERFERRAAEGLREDIAAARRRITRTVLRRGAGALEEAAATAALAPERAVGVRRVRGLVEELKSGPRPSIPAIVVFVRELWRLAR